MKTFVWVLLVAVGLFFIAILYFPASLSLSPAVILNLQTIECIVLPLCLCVYVCFKYGQQY